MVLLLVSCFWAQADDGAPGSSEADRAAIAASADAASGCDGDAPGTANPAAVYCGELGYEYEIVDTVEGQYGTCAFPDGSKCDGWRFLEGKCGQGFSYCASQGYGLITKSDGKNPFSVDYSVCVHDGQEVGAVSELMGLGEKATRGSRRVEQAAAPPEEGVAAVGQPASFDWRNYDGQDWMTSVKDQAYCGGCWAFSAIGTTEAVHNIAASDPTLDLNLSEEYLVSDCYDFWAASCCGGFQSGALKFIRDDGIPDEACLPWVSGTCGCDPQGVGCGPPGAPCTYDTGDLCSNATCSDKCGNWETRLETIASMGRVSIDPGRIKQHVVDKGPLAVALGINLPGSGFDANDVYRCTVDDELNHAVVIAGYNDAGGYWIVKNSWGATWGPDSNGYFKVGYGECGIETDVYYGSLADQTCTSYTSTDVPKAVPDPGTVTSNLNVGDSFTLADVNVGPLTISHEWDDDLDVFLISPIGTRVELFTDIGGGGEDFIDTILDDENVYQILWYDSSEYAPFSWTFSPEGVLADLDGEDSSGQWQLEITDDYGTDQGTLNSWELELCMSDQDGDRMPDDYEGANLCLDSLVADAGADPDGDDLASFGEMTLGTDPCSYDASLATHSDGDGFTDGLEQFLGTDPLDGCPDVTGTPGLCPGPSCDGHDAWPPDLDIDREVDIADVITGFLGKILAPEEYDRRADFKADGQLRVADIILGYYGRILTSCTP